MSHVAQSPRVLVTGAQTGGHLYPAQALSRFLKERGVEVTLVASGEGIEAKVLADSPVPVEVLRVGKWKGMGLGRRLVGMAGLPGSLLRAVRLVRRLHPEAVIGFGGYTSGPVVLAAALLGVPTAICEENAVPGLTNRLLAPFVRVAFVPSEVAGRRLRCRRFIVSGVPVRPEVLAVESRHPGPGPRRVLVLGGSQGSAFLNARIPPVLGRVARRLGGLEVIHQTGKGRAGAVRRAYADAGVAARVEEYLSKIHEIYAWADFVVARSGAGTVSEVAAVGLPALFVPFAAATDDHQAANAEALVGAGGAFLVREGEFREESVAQVLGDVLESPERLGDMGRRCRAEGRRDALEVIGRHLLEWVGQGDV